MAKTRKQCETCHDDLMTDDFGQWVDATGSLWGSDSHRHRWARLVNGGWGVIDCEARRCVESYATQVEAVEAAQHHNS